MSSRITPVRWRKPWSRQINEPKFETRSYRDPAWDPFHPATPNGAVAVSQTRFPDEAAVVDGEPGGSRGAPGCLHYRALTGQGRRCPGPRLAWASRVRRRP